MNSNPNAGRPARRFELPLGNAPISRSEMADGSGTTRWVSAAAVILTCVFYNAAYAESITGKVISDGKPIGGCMVSAFDEDRRQITTVFTQSDGSFEIDGLRDIDYTLRTRLMGWADEWIDDVEAGESGVEFNVQKATGEDLEEQRPANSGFGMLKFANMRDKENFKMMCSYCHQCGTIPFRTPEKPVDWHTMLRRMDGFGGLYRHTQETIVQRLIDTYKDDAVDGWPEFVPPPPPKGTATKAKITAWEIGKRLESSFHDLEPGPNGLMYAVNISKHYLVTLDTHTGEQIYYKFPRGSYGPHSIEPDNEGHMWVTMCATGQMAKFDVEKKDFTLCSSAEAPRKRGGYPHTLRINPDDPEGLVWYTDAGENRCYALHPRTYDVKKYQLLKANQAVAAGKGESRGITPYGLDYSPVDGMIWYSKLNGNRIGRIDPNIPDGDIREWNPPFRGPRRLHVAPNGMVWVPGFGSGVFGRFNPKTEEWTVYDLPDAENQIPYALNIDKHGFVWICGTGNDTINRFDPRTEELVEIRLPMRVSYTREIEFDDEGNVWTSTSGPSRHMERGLGQIIRIELPDGVDNSGGIKLTARHFGSNHKVGNQLPDFYSKSPNGRLFAFIDGTDLPAGYRPQTHQDYVDKRMAGMTEKQRNRVGRLWSERRKIDPNMQEVGQTFVRILEYVAEGEKPIPPENPNSASVQPVKLGVTGLVRYDGPPPQRQMVHMFHKGERSDCAPLHEGGLPEEKLIVSRKGGLANTFVYVRKGVPRKKFNAPDTAAVLNQDGCMFRPRVQGLMIGQDLVMKNGDPVLHNIRAIPFRNRPFNIAQPAGSEDRSKQFSRKEKAVTIQCDLHPWMKAYCFVMDHPYFAVTDAQGHFEIDGLEPGEYTLEAWHEELGDLEVEVTIPASRAATANFVFKPKKSEFIEPKSRVVTPTVARPNPSSPSTARTVKPSQPSQKWKLEDFAGSVSNLASRSRSHGKKVFTSAGCIKCHQIAGQGKKFGPELTQVSKQYRGAELLQQMLKPSVKIHKDFQTHLFVRSNGKVVSGLVLRDSTGSLDVLPNPLKPEEVTTLKHDEIEARRISEVSTMPEGLLNTLSKAEVLDLLAYVESGGQVNE